jgi:NAD(P)-dependent dehydrogenase (short-subunit alcohol dehydrogenase family)
MRDLRDKVAVVTGGGSGIGRGIARALAEAGTTVVVADIELDAAEAVAKELDGSAVQVDVSSLESVRALADRAFEEHGAVHVLCNNAGVGVVGPLLDMTPEDWRWLISVNVEGVVHGLVSFLPRMREQAGEAHVVNTASVTALAPLPGLGVYSVTKSAVLALSDVLRQEVAPEGIGVTAVCPGTVRTRILEADRNRPEALASSGAAPEAREVDMSGAIDPDELGRQIRAAILDDTPYVIPLAANNAGVADLAEARFASLLEALR